MSAVQTSFQQRPVLPANGVLSRTSSHGEWNGITAQAVEWHCEGESNFDLTCSRYRVGFVLEQSGGYCETRTHPGLKRGYLHHGRPFINLSPPQMPVWACSENIRHTRSLSLVFDRTTLNGRLDEELDPERDLAPRLNFEHPQLCTLAQLLAAECNSPGAFGALYADSLIVAIMVGLVRLRSPTGDERQRYRLAPWQLRTATEYMDAKLSGPITLRELAAATGLSQSHFGRAFKASTGVAPYRWHLNARIQRAQQLLLNEREPIAEIAALTGFADQAHLTRAFVRATGATPAAWRKDRRR